MTTGVQHFFVEQNPPMVGVTPLEAAEIDFAYMKSVNA